MSVLPFGLYETIDANPKIVMSREFYFKILQLWKSIRLMINIFNRGHITSRNELLNYRGQMQQMVLWKLLWMNCGASCGDGCVGACPQQPQQPQQT